MYNQLPEYNGWTNKPTWIVGLWLNNDQYSNETWTEFATAALHENDCEDEARQDLAEQIKYYFEDEAYPLNNASAYTDLLNFSLAFVDWEEIAQTFIETAKEQ